MTRLMRTGRAAFVHIVVVGFLTGLRPAVASAQCVFATMTQAMASPTAVAVFSGTVSEIEESAGAVAHVVTFDVQRVWKGTIARRVSLYQLNTNEAIQFSAGVPYLLVARRLPPEKQEVSGTIRRATTLEVATCVSKTLEQAERRGDLRELGPGQPPR